ncbi:hypothetical protein [Streptomyces sp. NPDC047097]|uniref:hypothetical protein n=1 Tax=Streptomyces sp. NPDC047097 TaxID=3155260 RepID=UPI003406D647
MADAGHLRRAAESSAKRLAPTPPRAPAAPRRPATRRRVVDLVLDERELALLNG